MTKDKTFSCFRKKKEENIELRESYLFTVKIAAGATAVRGHVHADLHWWVDPMRPAEAGTAAFLPFAPPPPLHRNWGRFQHIPCSAPSAAAAVAKAMAFTKPASGA